MVQTMDAMVQVVNTAHPGMRALSNLQSKLGEVATRRVFTKYSAFVCFSRAVCVAPLTLVADLILECCR